MFYDLSLGAVSANQAVLELALEQQQGSKNFAPGRVVILRDRVSESFLDRVERLGTGI